MTTHAKRFSVSNLVSSDISASYIIEGGTAEERLQTAIEMGSIILNNSTEKILISPDFTVTNLEGGIGAVREMLRSMGFKPYSGLRKVIVLPEIQTLTLPAQNALLKALEEPSDHTILLITTPDSTKIIATIRSRCQIISLPQSTASRDQKVVMLYRKLLIELAGNSLAQRLDLIQSKIKDREDLPDLLHYWIELLHTMLNRSVISQAEPNVHDLAEAAKIIQQGSQLLEDNVNSALSLDFIALYLPIITIPMEDHI